MVTLAVRTPSAPALGVTEPTTCASVMSTSVNAIVPLSLRLPTGVTSSSTAPVTSAAATIGPSLVPVIVTSICLVISPPCWSSSVIVKLSTFFWPAARYSTAASATV